MSDSLGADKHAQEMVGSFLPASRRATSSRWSYRVVPHRSTTRWRIWMAIIPLEQAQARAALDRHPRQHQNLLVLPVVVGAGGLGQEPEGGIHLEACPDGSRYEKKMRILGRLWGDPHLQFRLPVERRRSCRSESESRRPHTEGSDKAQQRGRREEPTERRVSRVGPRSGTHPPGNSDVMYVQRHR